MKLHAYKFSLEHSITSYCTKHSLSPDECVRQMRERVKEETCLTVSAGIAPNKVWTLRCSAIITLTYTFYCIDAGKGVHNSSIMQYRYFDNSQICSDKVRLPTNRPYQPRSIRFRISQMASSIYHSSKMQSKLS